MPATARPGQVITFYSYKGGTGRSMALSNVASVLAHRHNTGPGILMVDWDLEAPGLHRYFRMQLKEQLGTTDDRVLDERPGLIDLFWELHTRLQQQNGARRSHIEEDDAVALLEEIKLSRFILDTGISGLSLLKAGRFNEAYASQVNTFPWETFYHQAPLLLRVFAETLAEQYRYVLVDSRTGLTDVSGICTMLLPEKLVVVFTPNRQSLTGILGLVQRATDYRRQSDDLRPLVIFPLASRIEPTENTLRQYWRKGNADQDIIGYQPQFEQMFQTVYGLENCRLDTYFNHALIQHVPPYAYGENVAVLAEQRGESLVLAQRYETFAQLLVHARAPWDGSGQPALREESPYRALLPFHAADAELFFGRQEVVEQLRQRLMSLAWPFLVIDGPSGSGKTSLLQAGVIPQLRTARPTWEVVFVQPGTDPFTILQLQGFTGAEHDLTDAIRHWQHTHPVRDRLVLILDQFETLLLHCPVQVRERFLTQLEHTLHSRLPLSVVVVMRNDFRPILAQYLPPSLLETWWKANTVSLPTTLERDALNDIVREPAAAVGLAFQDGLIETIVDNAIEIAPTRGERGRVAQSTVLPLLEHALHTLWQRRTEGFVTHEAYHAIGELTGALPQLAEAAFTQLSTEEQSLARHVLMQLVQVGDTSLGSSDTRQRRFLADLSPSVELRDNIHQVIEKLGTSRLVVTSVEHNQATVELMHGVLLDWPRFQQWLSADRPFLLWKQRLQFALDEWKRTAGDKEQGGLLRGALLEEAEQWLRERSDNLSADEQHFVHASLVLRKAEEKEKEAQRKLEMEAQYQQRELEAAQTLAQEAERRREAEAQARQEAEIRAMEQATAARRLRLGAFFLLGALLVAAGLGVQTCQLLTESRVQTRKTFAKQLAFQADLVRNQSPLLLEWSKLIAIEAMSRFPSLEADQALRAEFTLLQRASQRLPHEDSVYQVVFSPDGARLATASGDKTARLWEVASGKELARLPHEGSVNQVVFSPDGARLATASFDKTARLWEVASGKELARLPHEDSVNRVVFSPDGARLATASFDKTARLWEVASGKEQARFPHEGSVYQVVFSPDGARLATASFDKTARLWVWRPEDMIATTCSRLNRNLTRAEWRQYLGNEPYHKTCADLPIGTDFLDEGKQLAKDGKVQAALAVYAQARQIDPTLNISAVDWNQLCWFGSLSGQATAIMKACQQAVSLDPEDGGIRDSRGLARALTGDTKGAIEDFSFFVEWTKKTGQQANLREQREQWIAALKAGKKPFDAETLKKLREH